MPFAPWPSWAVEIQKMLDCGGSGTLLVHYHRFNVSRVESYAKPAPLRDGQEPKEPYASRRPSDQLATASGGADQ